MSNLDLRKQLTDRDWVALAKQEYQPLEVGQDIVIGHHCLGQVLQHYYAADGMQLFVVGQNPHPKQVVILFKGSSGLRKGNLTTFDQEWLTTNLPILEAMLIQKRTIPSQLKTAARTLNQLCHQYQDAKLYLVGHSLGAINLQFALAHCRFIGQIRAAYLYEGTNLYPLLSRKEKHHVRKFRHKVNNYVDIYDPVTLGYVNCHDLIGKLRLVASSPMPPIHQHMWGGYHFDINGKVQLRQPDQEVEAVVRHQQELIKITRSLGQRSPLLNPTLRVLNLKQSSLTKNKRFSGK